MKKLLCFSFLLLFIFSCSKEDGLILVDDTHSIETRGIKLPKTKLCHKTGFGFLFIQIEVNGHAVGAHLDHGDALPGTCYDDGLYMTEDCIVIDVSDVEEVCNGLDDNCDGNIDEGVFVVCYADNDGDGFGDATTFLITCECPPGYVTDCSDCDDENADVNPEEEEQCDNGVDDNCDGEDCECPEGFIWNPDTFLCEGDAPVDCVGHWEQITDCEDLVADWIFVIDVPAQNGGEECEAEDGQPCLSCPCVEDP